ncbi:nucleotide sugar dehydrogenase [Halobacteriales archaeon Cl-PHB]
MSDSNIHLERGSASLSSSETGEFVGDVGDTEQHTRPGVVPEQATICVVGLGYVGLPLATAFDAADQTVIGYDVDQQKVDSLAAGSDPTGDVGDDRIDDSSVRFTTDPAPVARADYVIITVPTPVDDHDNPNLDFVEAAGQQVGEHLSPGATVVLESTVFPGATREVLVPALEETSGLTADEEFAVGYSPERASPGETGRGVSDVVKIVGADDEATREELAKLYGRVVDAGIYRAPDTQTAEAAKVIENVQRDINIALVNELAMVCDELDIDTEEVLDAAGSKWNFHDEYSPGLVGGHCIPVDPHFLAHRSEGEGFSPKLVLQAREINSHLPTHVADLVVRTLNDCRNVLRESRVLVLGLSYKANVGDIRTSEVDAVVDELESYDVDVAGFDPHADDDAMRQEFEVPVQETLDPSGFDGIVVATAHDEFDDLNLDTLATEMSDDPLLVDVPGSFDPEAAAAAGFEYRRL